MLEVHGLDKAFGRGHRSPVQALDGVDLVVNEGEFATVLGPSGCGKSTLLRCIAGFEQPDSGTITVSGRVLNGPGRPVPAYDRGIGVVPQDGALFPHLNVAQNVAFGLIGHRRSSRRERSRRVHEVLDLVGMAGLHRRRPHELSGGQQQRVALARALAPAPRLILLDEPFSSLDAQLRASLRVEVRDLLASIGTTTVMVTHDQEEAMELADRLIVMRSGRVIQSGNPHDTYRRPEDLALATFLGEAVVVDGCIDSRQPDRVQCVFGSLPIGDSHGGTGACRVMIRPEDIRLASATDEDASATHCARGIVCGASYYGHDALVRIRVSDLAEPVQVRVIGASPFDAGTPVRLTVPGPVSTYPDNNPERKTDPIPTQSGEPCCLDHAYALN